MGQEELMFRYGVARKTFCGQVREHIVDFRDTNLPERWRTRRWGMPYHV